MQVTVEQRVLEEDLLTEPAIRAPASQLLASRTASADTVTQILSQLDTKPPQELWTLVHADSGPAGKGPSKAAAAKGPAAAKGKPGDVVNTL